MKTGPDRQGGGQWLGDWTPPVQRWQVHTIHFLNAYCLKSLNYTKIEVRVSSKLRIHSMSSLKVPLSTLKMQMTY